MNATHVFEKDEKNFSRTRKAGFSKGGDAQSTEGRRYTDSRVDEQKRGLSIKAAPMTLLMQAPSEKHYLVNIIDTPGHLNFSDEVSAGLRLADGALLVVDVIEGVATSTERMIRHALREKLQVRRWLHMGARGPTPKGSVGASRCSREWKSCACGAAACGRLSTWPGRARWVRHSTASGCAPRRRPTRSAVPPARCSRAPPRHAAARWCRFSIRWT